MQALEDLEGKYSYKPVITGDFPIRFSRGTRIESRENYVCEKRFVL
jgi:hypothetical protein